MTAKEFEDYVFDNADKDYGICPPPTDARVGMDILIEHFLGKDWYYSLPLGVEQGYTEAIYSILKKYPKRNYRHKIAVLLRSIADRIDEFLKNK